MYLAGPRGCLPFAEGETGAVIGGDAALVTGVDEHCIRDRDAGGVHCKRFFHKVRWGRVEGGSTLATEVCPLVTFVAVREDAVASLVAIGCRAYFKPVSLFLAINRCRIG
jgi:hypothetical protein